MIISDLNHFEEVVAEAPHVVGGENVKTTLAKLDPELATELKAAGFGNLLGIQINVSSKSVKNSDGAASVKAAVGKTKQGDQIRYSSSDSTAVNTN